MAVELDLYKMDSVQLTTRHITWIQIIYFIPVIGACFVAILFFIQNSILGGIILSLIAVSLRFALSWRSPALFLTPQYLIVKRLFIADRSIPIMRIKNFVIEKNQVFIQLENKEKIHLQDQVFLVGNWNNRKAAIKDKLIYLKEDQKVFEVIAPKWTSLFGS